MPTSETDNDGPGLGNCPSSDGKEKPLSSSREMRAALNRAMRRFADQHPDETDLPFIPTRLVAIAWTPPDSVQGLGTILLNEPPIGSLTPQAYRFALQSRLERLIVAAGEDAPGLLKLAEENEPGLHHRGTPAQIAQTMVESSNWLAERAGMPIQPVTAPLTVDWDGLEFLQGENDMLEDYLSALYYVGRGD